MNVRLQTLLTQAQSLPGPDQDDLADMIEAFMADHAGLPDVTPEELDHLMRLASKPFEAADPEEVAALLGRRG